MADFSALKAAIQAVIKQNGNQEITGPILQEVLLSMVNTMGDGAINSLMSALSTETTNRQNTDGTLQNNINSEATARQNADAGLQTAINSINTRLAEGYVYVGIATAATNPGTPSGKVFYIATAAGTYTNFGGLSVTQGINILKYNGSAWSVEQIVGIDDVPTAGSDNLVKSGVVFKVKEQALQNKTDISELTLLTPSSSVDNSFIRDDGQVRSNQQFRYDIYPVTGGNLYTFSGKFGTNTGISFILWYDANSEIICSAGYRGNPGSGSPEKIYTDQLLIAPENAAYAYMNVNKDYSLQSNFQSVDDAIKSKDLKKQITDLQIVVSGNTNNISELRENVNDVTEQTLQNTADISEVTELSASETIDNSFFYTDNSIRSNQTFKIVKFLVTGGSSYLFSGEHSDIITSTIPYVGWLDSSNNIIKIEPYDGAPSQFTEQLVVAPNNAVAAYLNIEKEYEGTYSFKSVGSVIKSRELEGLIQKNEVDISKNKNDITDITGAISQDVLLQPDSVVTGKWIYEDGTERSNQSCNYNIYNVTGGEKYRFSASGVVSSRFYFVHWFDENHNWIGKEPYNGLPDGQSVEFVDILIQAPQNAAYAYCNYLNFEPYVSTQNFKAVEIIKSQDLQPRGEKLMKVVVNSVGAVLGSLPFYIRSRYNAEKDIINVHAINQNGIITFYRTYIGAKALSDAQIMVDANMVSQHQDSTAPLFNSTQYWHLFAQHGYPVPYFDNSVGMTSADVGALWKDQSNREYHIGKVTSSRVYLLPVIYQDADGHDVRDWHSTLTSAAITNLTYISGGSDGAYTSPITLSTYYQEQLRPIMSHSDMVMIADGQNITTAGIYYCDEFKVSESQIGYDPATIQDWFGGDNGTPDLTGAEPMAKFTYSFNYKGANCCVNTTINILREVECVGYGACQQQFFLDNGDYKAMFMIPKAKTRDGVVFEKPFNSPLSTSPEYYFYRNSYYLNNPDNLIDRQIGFLHNPNDGKYLVGMAAGLSLVSGNTVNSKRLNDIPLWTSNDYHQILLTFSPSNTNKFYIMAFNTANYAADDYYLPVGFFREVNYYVSFFDPAENIGQVYWYKDGSKYIIYCHCQSVQNGLAINVPDFMEGLNLSVVEKTSNAELLTDTITNRKFFVNYTTDDANYIVLKAE